MIGKSMGAVVAVMTAQKRPGDVAAMCLWYPGFGVAETAKVGFFLGEIYDPENPPETLTVAGYTYGRAFLKELKTIDYESAIRNYDGPVLILHGAQDFVAPLIFSFWAKDLFHDCTLHVIPGGWHGFIGEAEYLSLYDMINFLQRQTE